MYVPSWPPGNSANGIVTYASYMIPALRDLGHEVFILTWGMREPDQPYVFPLKKFQTPLPFWNRALFKISSTNALYCATSRPMMTAIRELVSQHAIEIVEIEESFGLSYAISNLSLIPVVVRLHGPWFLTKQHENTRREKLEGRAIKAADTVTTPSRHTLRSVRNHYGLALANAAVFGNPIVPPSRQWQLSNCDKNSVLFVGRFDEMKGGDLIVNAFGELAKKNPLLKLTFVGPDNGFRGNKLIDYARSALSSNAFSRFTYKGTLAYSEVAKLRMQHFITVCASKFEVFGYTVLEAMAFGCPVVASDVGGIPELIRSGKNGMLFESQNGESLVSTIQSLFDNPQLAEKLGRAARLSAEEYRPEAMAASVTSHYEQTIRDFKLRRKI